MNFVASSDNNRPHGELALDSKKKATSSAFIDKAMAIFFWYVLLQMFGNKGATRLLINDCQGWLDIGRLPASDYLPRSVRCEREPRVSPEGPLTSFAEAHAFRRDQGMRGFENLLLSFAFFISTNILLIENQAEMHSDACQISVLCIVIGKNYWSLSFDGIF